MTWQEFLATKLGLWIDTRSSTDNTLHCSGRAAEKSGILFQIEKAAKASGGELTCYMFSLEDAVAHLAVTGILTIEKLKKNQSIKMKSHMLETFWTKKIFWSQLRALMIVKCLLEMSSRQLSMARGIGQGLGTNPEYHPGLVRT